MNRENISPLAVAAPQILPVVPLRASTNAEAGAPLEVSSHYDAAVVVPDLRLEVRHEETGETYVSRLHRLDMTSLPLMFETLVLRSTPFEAAPLDRGAGLRPVATVTIFATDDGWQAATTAAARSMGVDFP